MYLTLHVLELAVVLVTNLLEEPATGTWGKKKKKKKEQSNPNVWKGKAPALACDISTRPTPHSPQSRHGGQGLWTVHRLQHLTKRDLEAGGGENKRSILVPAALTEGLSSPIPFAATSISTNFTAPAPAYWTFITNVRHSYQKRTALNTQQWLLFKIKN